MSKRRNQQFKRSLLTLGVISSLGVSDYSVAQMLEEVLVTARKRTESLQEVPMAVSAFSADQLQAAQIDNILDLERMTPNITLTETSGLQGGHIGAYIRGIGNDPSFDQGVGIYLDDVYMNRTTGALLQVYDVERIEVLKGPQGNLYGRNTIGGAIKYITREPSDELTGDVEVRYGEFDLMQVKAGLSGPIMENTLKGSVGLLYRERDGIQENTLNGDEYWEDNKEAYRGSLLWDANENVRFKLAGDYFKDDSAPLLPNRSGINGTNLGFLSLIGTGAHVLAPGAGLFVTPNDVSLPGNEDEVSTEFADGLDEFEIEATTLALTAYWDINDNWSFKSITAHRKVDHVQVFDFDGSEQVFIRAVNDREFEDFSQEFQFNYESEDVKAVMGYYYLDGKGEVESGGPDGATLQTARLRGFTSQAVDTLRDERDVTSHSVYANVDWNFNEQWQLSLGGRYTEDEKRERQASNTIREVYAQAVAPPPFGFLNALGFGLPVELGMEEAVEASPDFAGWFTPHTRGFIEEVGASIDVEDTWSEFSPSVRLTWFTNDDLMFYTGFSSGFKSGGFNRQGSMPTPFEPEIVDSYVLGMKSTWLDNSVRVNGEIFYNDYQEKQLATIGLVGDDLTLVTDNVGKLESSGVELETTWLPPVNGLVLGLNVGYLDTDVKEFIEFTEEGPVDIADSTAMGFAPEWTVQARVSWNLDLGGAGNLMVGADVNYRTETYTTLTVDTTTAAAEAQIQEEHAIYNALAAWSSPDQAWRIAVEGKNLSDERVQVNTFDLNLFQTTGWNLPRTWAVSVGYTF